MKKWQKFSTISLSLAAAAVAIFLFVFFFAPANKGTAPSLTPSHAATEIDPSNLPTDYWTDYAIQPATGTGTAANPYIITSGEELAWFESHSAGYVELGSDIDLSAHLWKSIWAGQNFEGNNHTISGLTINSQTGGHIGFFRNVSSRIEAKNFKIVNSLILANLENYTSSSGIGFVVSGVSNSNANDYYQNISVQNSQIEVINFSGETHVGSVLGFPYSSFETKGISAINVSIRLSSQKAKGGVFVGGISGHATSAAGYADVVENVKVNIDLPSSFTNYCYVGEYAANTTAASRNCFINFSYELEATTPANKIRFNKVTSNLNTVRPEDNITVVPEGYDKNIWSDADLTSSFKYIIPDNDWLIEYYSLNTNFVSVEFWEDYSKKPYQTAATATPTYRVRNANELAWFINNGPNKVQIELESDIDLVDKYWTPIKKEVILVGKDHVIRNMTINLDYEKSLSYRFTTGLFVRAATSAVVSVSNTIIESPKIIGENAKNATVGIIAAGNSNYYNGNLYQVSVQKLNVNVTTKNAFTLYCFTQGIFQSNKNSSHGGFSVLDAEVKINSTNYVNVYGGPTLTRENLKQFVFTGKINIETTSNQANVYVAGFSSTSYYAYDCLVGADISITRNGLPFGTVKFFTDKNLSCMVVSDNIVANSVQEVEYKNSTSIPTSFDLTVWSEKDVDNQQWQYVFPLNVSFMKYYGLTGKTSNNLWSQRKIKPREGSGSQASPWHIYTAEELAWLTECTTASQFYVYLEADIDLGAYKWDGIGTDQAYPYSVYIYGQNHKISNINAGYETTVSAGFINKVSHNLYIYDTTFENLTVRANDYAGLTGYIVNGSPYFSNVHVIDADIVSKSGSAGGLLAFKAPTSIVDVDNCSVSGQIKAQTSAGGIIGATNGLGKRYVDNSVNYASVVSAIDRAEGIGGTIVNNCINFGSLTGQYLAGIGYGGTSNTFSNCLNYGELNATGSQKYAGGIACKGDINTNGETIINNCINYGKINNANGYSGGIMAYGMAKISGCKNSADVIGTFAGGICGVFAGTIENCSNIGNITGKSAAGGIVGDSTITTAGSNLTITDVVSICDVVANNGSSNVSYAGGILGSFTSNASQPLKITRAFYNGSVTSSSLAVGGILAYTNKNTNIDSCYAIAKLKGGSLSSSAYGIGGLVGAVNTNKLTASNCAFKGEIISSSARALPFVYNNNGSTEFSSCYYDATLKKSESGDATIFKNYILGQDETEESAFSNEIWGLYDGLEISSVPFIKTFLWQEEFLETDINMVGFLKENGFTAAA